MVSKRDGGKGEISRASKLIALQPASSPQQQSVSSGNRVFQRLDMPSAATDSSRRKRPRSPTDGKSSEFEFRGSDASLVSERVNTDVPAQSQAFTASQPEEVQMSQMSAASGAFLPSQDLGDEPPPLDPPSSFVLPPNLPLSYS